MVFQGVRGAEQLVFFTVLMIVVYFGTGVKIVVAELQPRGACRSPVGWGLRLRLPVGQAYTSSLIATSSADARILFIRPTHFI